MEVSTDPSRWEHVTSTAHPVPSSQLYFSLFCRIVPSRFHFVSRLLSRQIILRPVPSQQMLAMPSLPYLQDGRWDWE